MTTHLCCRAVRFGLSTANLGQVSSLICGHKKCLLHTNTISTCTAKASKGKEEQRDILFFFVSYKTCVMDVGRRIYSRGVELVKDKRSWKGTGGPARQNGAHPVNATMSTFQLSR